MGWLRIFFFPESSLLYTVELYIGVVIFSLYIVFDVSMICHKLGYDDYVVAALELYLDIINLSSRSSPSLAGNDPSRTGAEMQGDGP